MLSRAVKAGPLLRGCNAVASPACTPRQCYQFSTSILRLNSKPSMSNIAEIRRRLPGTTMVKAKEALTQTSNDLSSAIEWLEKDSAISGAKKASKVQGRVAKEGGIGITVIVDGAPGTPAASVTAAASSTSSGRPGLTLAAKAGIVEVNCETDFVGRNEIFQAFLADLSHTVALFPTMAALESEGTSSSSSPSSSSSASSQDIIDIPVQALLEFPLLAKDPLQQQQQQQITSNTASSSSSSPLPKTVGATLLDLISRLGENITLTRASALGNVAIPDAHAPRRSETETNTPWLVASAFTHGGVSAAPSTTSPSASSLAFSSNGRVGALLLSRFQQPGSSSKEQRRDESSIKAMRAMAKSLARQSAGMPTRSIRDESDTETSLYHQPFIMKLKAAELSEQLQQADDQGSSSEQSVQQALTQWGKVWMGGEQASEAVAVLQLRRWELGEDIPVESSNTTTAA